MRNFCGAVLGDVDYCCCCCCTCTGGGICRGWRRGGRVVVVVVMMMIMMTISLLFFLPSSSQIPHRMHNRFFLWDSSPREFITAIGSQPIGVEACL